MQRIGVNSEESPHFSHGIFVYAGGPFYPDLPQLCKQGHTPRFCRKVASSKVWLSVSRCMSDIRFLDFAPKIELCDRTLMLPGSTTNHENRIYKATQTP